ncbi:MAG TPA: ABC transporter substrate-binding protein [Stellaceae bacterium]|nr:ABC transporter substrate-binding protein [Stellaceae bacterium]
MRVRPFLILCALLIGLGPARAAPPDAALFIDRLVAEALDTIRDKDLPDAVKTQRLDALLKSSFDIPRISRYVLGRFWNATSEPDRRTFAELFESWVVRSYAGRLSEYRGEGVKVVGARPEGDGGAVVSSEIIHESGPPTKVEWRVAGSGNDYKILDVDVAGVSMALTEREEIAATIQQNGGTVAQLNRVLARKLGIQNTADASH